MEINRDHLKNALLTCKPAVAAKELIPQTTCYCFTEECVVAYNDEIAIQVPFSAGFTGAVSAVEFFGFLDKCKTDTVDLAFEENLLLVKSGRAKASIPFHLELSLPMDEIMVEKKWQKLPSDFSIALEFCIPCVSTDMTRAVLTAVNVQASKIEACDSFRIAEYTYSAPVKGLSSFLLPASSAKQLSRFSPTRIATSEGWVHFANAEGAIFSARTLADKYPDTSKVWEMQSAVDAEFPSEIEDILARAANFFKADDTLQETIVVSIGNGKVEISCKSVKGEFKEFARSPYKGEPIVFGMTPSFLSIILKMHRTFQFSGSKIIFTDENWRYLAQTKTID